MPLSFAAKNCFADSIWIKHLSESHVSIQLRAAKDCHCERSEAISGLGGLLVGPASCRSFLGDSPVAPTACPTVHSSQ